MIVVKFYRTLILAIALAVPCVSHAEYFDGYKLKTLIDADDRTDSGNFTIGSDVYDSGVFFGFVVGVHDTFEGINIICTNNQVKAGQILAVVKKYVKDHPEKLDRPAKTLVFLALATAFPCNKK